MYSLTLNNVYLLIYIGTGLQTNIYVCSLALLIRARTFVDICIFKYFLVNGILYIIVMDKHAQNVICYNNIVNENLNRLLFIINCILFV